MRLEEITIEKVREAYKKTGLRPRSGEARVVDGRCCALGVLGYAETKDTLSSCPEQGSTEKRILSLGINLTDGWEFGMGFDAGFDGYSPEFCGQGYPWYDQGYKIGRAMRRG